MGGRIVEVPAHLDWSLQIDVGTSRRSSMRVMRHIGSTLVSGFIFRPFVMLLLPGLLLLLFSLYVNAWVVYEFFRALPRTGGELYLAALAVYREHPQTLFIGTLSLVLATQLIGMGAMSLQNARYFKDAYYMGVELRRAVPDRDVSLLQHVLRLGAVGQDTQTHAEQAGGRPAVQRLEGCAISGGNLGDQAVEGGVALSGRP